MYKDTIAAISTPLGEGGIGIIRLSGPKALEISLNVLRTKEGARILALRPRQVYYGQVVDPQTNLSLDEALFFYAKQPRSFTAEDTVEIQAHGSNLLLSRILSLLLANGARLAEPGEFTQRAYLNGRIDLVQAEAIIDLIRAKTEKAQQMALTQLTGQTTQAIFRIEAALYQILIAIEALLDFPEEGLPETKRQEVGDQVKLLGEQLTELLHNASKGQRLREGVLVAIIGPPNVGKSSLLNAFLEEERAIVTEIPGTTRDVIEAQLQLGGVPLRLVDTAGLRQTDNPIEQIGIAKAEAYLKTADLILLVLDGSQPLNSSDRELLLKFTTRQVLVVINKTDLPQCLTATDLPELNGSRILETSLKTGSGIAELLTAIQELLDLGRVQFDDTPLLSRVRHRQALESACAALEHFQKGWATGISEDLLAVDLRSCLEAIGAITGKNVSTEVIHGIFAQFCIWDMLGAILPCTRPSA